jgi:molybdopterin adenylyltransferase
MIRTAILTVSDRSAAGQREDRSVQALREVLAQGPFVEVDYHVVPDEQPIIRSKLRILTEGGIDLVLTTGGTGLALRDRTPEATLEVVERVVPGLAEAMRAEGARDDPRAWLSRGIVGVRKSTLVVNLPGSPTGARASFAAIARVLPHAVDVLQGRVADGPGAAPAAPADGHD